MPDPFSTAAAESHAPMPDLVPIFGIAVNILNSSARELILLAAIFGIAGWLLRRRIRAAGGFRLRCKWPHLRLNLVYYAIDAVILTPLLTLLALAIATAPISLVSPDAYAGWPGGAVAFLALAASDFTGYWRHRLMHVPGLWPVHAAHHSDPQMTWLTLARFHPVNRLITTACSAAALTVLGLPAWAVALNAVVRHFYGYFIHADLPIDYGPAGRILVSPAMHRWHHARDVTGSGANFATVFAFWDVVFGTWYVPKAAPPALGIDETGYPGSWLGQTVWPLIALGRFLRQPGQKSGHGPAQPARDMSGDA